MATPSQVKAGLNEIANIISAQRAVMEKVKSNAQGASDKLSALPESYADVLATINGYDGADPFEALAKSELEKLTGEFVALKADADAVAGLEI